MSSSRTIIVTGAAGFIGAALVERLLKMNEVVIGIDNLNSYYSTSLKLKRLKLIDEFVGESNLKKNWHFYKKDIQVMDDMKSGREIRDKKFVEMDKAEGMKPKT